MSNDNQIDVKIKADGSGVAPGVAVAKAPLETIEPLVNEITREFKEMAASVRETMVGSATFTAAFIAELRTLDRETDKVGRGVGDIGRQTRSVTGEASLLGSMMGWVGGTIAAAFTIGAIGHFTKEMSDAAEQTYMMGQRLGITVGQVQVLKAMAETTGGSMDQYAMAIQRLDRVYAQAQQGGKQQIQAIHALGIEANGSHSNMDLLTAAMNKFSTMEDGPAKVALAMKLFGQQGATLIPILNQSKEDLADFTKQMEKYGVVNEGAIAKGNQLANAVDEMDLAFMGLSNTAMDALAPVLTELVTDVTALIAGFIQSYREGGTVATVMAVVAEAFGLARTAIAAVWDIIGALWDIAKAVFAQIGDLVWQVFGSLFPQSMATSVGFMNSLRDTIVFAKDVIVIALNIMGGAVITLVGTLRTLGDIAADVFTLDWGSIAGDWDAGMKRIESGVYGSMKRIMAAGKEAGQAWNGTLKLPTAPAAPTFKMPKLGVNTAGDYEGTGKGGGKEPSGPSLAQQWKTELADMLSAEENWSADELQLALKFWTEKKQLTTAGSKDELEVRREIARLRLAIHKEEQAEEINTIKDRVAMEQDLARTEIEIARSTIEAKLDAINAQEQAGQLSATRAAALRNDLNRQLYQLDLQLEQQTFDLKMKAFQDTLKLANLDVKTRDEINRQIELLEAQHLNRMALLKKQTDVKQAKDDEELTNLRRRQHLSVASSWGDNIAKMVTLQQGFMTTIRNGYMTLVGVFQQAIANMVRNWILGLLANEAASKTFHAKQVLLDAKAAAAGAWKAVVGIPVVGPILAPVAAAAAFAGVMAFASAEKGAWNVGADGQMFQLHKEEMVLPAHLAKPLRSMIEGPSANTNAPTPANDQPAPEVHHHHHWNAVDGASVRRFVMENKRVIAEAVGSSYRDGYRPQGS